MVHVVNIPHWKIHVKTYGPTFANINLTLLFVILLNLLIETQSSLRNVRFASASVDKTINIWSIELGECVKTLITGTSYANSLQLLANNILASGTAEGIRYKYWIWIVANASKL